MFITFEGPEGSGKSSQLPALAEFLRQQGRAITTTREPGGTEIGNQVRAVLMSLQNTAMMPRTEALLFCAARAQLVEQVIRPALGRGEVVLSDRYADSTLAYQGFGRGCNLDELRSLLNFATGGLWPDLTLLMDVPVEEGLRRKRSGGGEWNRLDAWEVALHQRIRQGFLGLARQNPERWIIIDASQSAEMVQLALRQAVLSRLK